MSSGTGFQDAKQRRGSTSMCNNQDPLLTPAITDFAAQMARRRNRSGGSRGWAAKEQAGSDNAELPDDESDEPLNAQELRVAFGSDVVVLCVCSSSLFVGYAADDAPLEVPCTVARSDAFCPGDARHECLFLAHDERSESARARIEARVGKCEPPQHSVKLLSERQVEATHAYNRRSSQQHPEAEASSGSKHFCTCCDGPIAAVGSDAITLAQQAHVQRNGGTANNFDSSGPANITSIAFPIVQGRVHVTDSRALHLVRDELHALFRHAVVHTRGIPLESIQSLSCVLVVGQRASYSDMRELATAVFGLGFSSIAVHRDSVAASFGVGAVTSCAVCLDSQYASAVCLDEGAELESSRFVLPHGGDHVSASLARMLKESNAIPPDLPSLTSQAHCKVLMRSLYDACWIPSERESEDMQNDNLGDSLMKFLSSSVDDNGILEKEYKISAGRLGVTAAEGLFEASLLQSGKTFDWEHLHRLGIASDEELTCNVSGIGIGAYREQQHAGGASASAAIEEGVEATDSTPNRGNTGNGRKNRGSRSRKASIRERRSGTMDAERGGVKRKSRQDHENIKAHNVNNDTDHSGNAVQSAKQKSRGRRKTNEEEENGLTNRHTDIADHVEQLQEEDAQQNGSALTDEVDSGRKQGGRRSALLSSDSSLVDLVVSSILASKSVDHARLCESIIVYGDASELHGLTEALESRLLQSLPEAHEYNTVDVRRHLTSSRHTAWFGAALAASIDPSRSYYWTTRAEWETGGARQDRRLSEGLHLYGALHTYASEASIGPNEPL